MSARKAKRAKITFDQALAELPAAEAELRAESVAYSQAYTEGIETLHKLYAIMATERGRTLRARRRVDQLRAVVDAGEDRSEPVRRYRDNPSITQGLLDAVANGEVMTSHKSMLPVDISLTLLVGGLARVKRKTEAQVMAATRYCHLYERAQIGAARATDYSQVRVDTSGPPQDVISARQDDYRRQYELARAALGDQAPVVEQVVVYGVSVRGLAKTLGLGEGGQARVRAERILLKAIDRLVDHFRLVPEARNKAHRWSDGSRAAIIREVDGEIVHSRAGGRRRPVA